MSEEINSITPTTDQQTNESPKLPRKDDLLWKSILEDVFEDFLCFFIPDAKKIFNFQKGFVYLDKEFDRLFPSNDQGAAGVRFVDKLVKVTLRSGQEKHILIHIEVQSFNSKIEPLEARMFRYFYRAKDKHNISIAAFAILTDQSRFYYPKPYQEKYLGTELTYKFNLYKLRNEDEQKLRADPNPFAIVALTVLMALKHKNANDDKLMNIKMDLAKELIRRKLSKKKHNSIMSFLKYYVNFNKPEKMIKFEEQIEQLTGRSTAVGINEYLFEKRYKTGREKGLEEGIEKGLEEGIQQGAELERIKANEEKLEIARTLKNLGVTIANIAKATGLSIAETQAL